MNIFFLDKDLKLCAQQHCDKHVVKMILELAQLLSTAHRVYDGEVVEVKNPFTQKSKKVLLLEDECHEWFIHDEKATSIIKNKKCCRATHINHPSSLWIRQSSSNYYWTFKLFKELLIEFEFRRNKKHKLNELLIFLSNIPNKIHIDNLTPPLLAMSENYKIKNVLCLDDAIDNYRNYYKEGKAHLHKWSKREKPIWI